MHRKNGSGKAFHFKQFHVHHDRCAMKVGTDAVLLGAWAEVAGAKTILDIGCGSGVIALMLAQRTPPETKITGVDSDEDSAIQATENVKQSPWSDKINIHHHTIQEFQSDSLFDLIVSNPPYFTRSLLPSSVDKQNSRHTQILTHTDLIINAKRLLKPNGRFDVILPFTEGLNFITEAAKSGLFCSRKWAFHSRLSRPAERLLLRFLPTSVNREENSISLYDEYGEWTETYRQLVSPFYLDSPNKR